VNNDILKQLVDKLENITIEKVDCVVIKFNQSNVNEANFLRKTLMTSPLFKKYGKRGIGVIMLPQDIELQWLSDVELKEAGLIRAGFGPYEDKVTIHKGSACGPSETNPPMKKTVQE